MKETFLFITAYCTCFFLTAWAIYKLIYITIKLWKNK